MISCYCLDSHSGMAWFSTMHLHFTQVLAFWVSHISFCRQLLAEAHYNHMTINMI